MRAPGLWIKYSIFASWPCLEHGIKNTSSQRIGSLVLRFECINGAIAGIGNPNDNNDGKNDADTVDFYYHRCLYRVQLRYYVVEDEVGKEKKECAYFANGSDLAVFCDWRNWDVGVVVFVCWQQFTEEFGLPGKRKELLARA